MAESNTNKSASARQPGSKDMASWRPGSEVDQAKNVGSAGDFGVPVGAGPSRDRDYVNENTKRSDPGASQPFDWEADGVRDHGAGAPNSGPGSGSGGDVDLDFVGVGTGGAAVGGVDPDAMPGPDDSDGTSNEFGSPLPSNKGSDAIIEPASGRNRGRVIQGAGTTVTGDFDMHTGPWGQGSDAATNPAARGDDSFAGEISSGEASGQDLSMSPSQDTQGLVPGENQVDGQKDFRDDD